MVGGSLWRRIRRRPALVLSPNSAIQAQWAARTDLFEFDAPPTELIGRKTTKACPIERYKSAL